MNVHVPVRLFTGRDCVRSGGAELRSLGRKALIVTGKTGAKRSGALADVTAALEGSGVGYAVFDAVGENPTVECCRRGGAAAREAAAEFVIGVGGGSALDAAKVVALMAADAAMDESKLYSGAWEFPPKPIALVGTTAGTGSEVTNVSVLTDSMGRKHSVHADGLYASLSFGDAKYTFSLPERITKNTAVDAFSHCLESYLSKKADGVSRTDALEGMQLLLPGLRRLAEDPFRPDEALRESLYTGSLLGGLAISITGTTFPHNVGYYLTERFAVPHGAACAAFLPALLRHCEKAAPALLRELTGQLQTSAEELTILFEVLTPLPEIAMTEAEIRAALPRWEKNGSVRNSPGTVTAEMIGTILRERFLREGA